MSQPEAAYLVCKKVIRQPSWVSTLCGRATTSSTFLSHRVTCPDCIHVMEGGGRLWLMHTTLGLGLLTP